MGRKDKKVSPESMAAPEPGTKMRLARQGKGVSLTSMAESLHYTKGYLSQVENNRIEPPDHLIKQYESLLKVEIGTGDGQVIRRRRSAPIEHRDLGEAPSVEQLYGRQQELADLQCWLCDDRCGLVAVLGIGGVGKTTLAAYCMSLMVTGKIRSDFEYVFWRSLQGVPSLASVLEQALLFIAGEISEEEGSSIDVLIDLLQKKRCLIVLDNFESVLASNNPVGQYREGYEEYARLLQRIGEVKHKSCLLLTSREKPGELIPMEGKESRVRSMTLSGMMEQAMVKSMLKGEDLQGTDEAWNDLITRYSGNPLALKVISAYIRDICACDIVAFLKQGEAAFGDISAFIDQQFHRLSPQEQHIMYWLAIRCEPVSFNELRQDILSPQIRNVLMESIDSLKRRFMIEIPKAAYFELQPVIADYVLNRFIHQAYDEIMSGHLDLFASHKFLKAQAQDHVREEQKRRIVQPVVEYLLNEPGWEGAEERLKHLLFVLREKRAQMSDYAAGNILDMLVYLGGGVLKNVDFSHLTVRQAYLVGVTLHNVNFAYADLRTCVFTQNFDGVASMALSPDGNLLATGTISGEVWFWDAVSGDPKFSLKSNDASWVCWSVAFSPDSNFLAVGSEDRSISIWDVRTEKLVKVLKAHNDHVRSVSFSPADGNVLVSSSDDNTIRFWNVREGRCFRILDEHTGCVNAIKFNQHGTLLASGSSDKTVRLWNVDSGECIKTIREQTGGIFSLDFSPDGKLLVTGGDYGKLYVWNVADGSCYKVLEGHGERIRAIVVFDIDGSTTIASGSEDKTIRLWNMDSDEWFKVLGVHSDRICSLVFNSVENILVTGSVDQTILFWNLDQGRYWRVKTLQGHMNAIRSLAFSPRENLLASGGEDNKISLRHVYRDTSNLSKVFSEHNNWVWSVVFDSNGDLLASGGDDKTMRLWDINTGECIRTFKGHSSWIRSIALSPNGQWLASGSAGHTIRLWAVNTGAFLKKLPGHTNRVRSVAFSPDGQWLASGGDDNMILLWRADPDEYYVYDRTLRSDPRPVWCVVFSPDGQWLASAGNDKVIRLWQMNGRGRSRPGVLETRADWTSALAFSPDGAILASGGSDKVVRLWDVRSRNLLKELSGHMGVVYAVTFSADGMMLSSAGREGAIKLWDMQTYENLQTLHSDRPYERTNIAHATGLSRVQIDVLKALGAVENADPS